MGNTGTGTGDEAALAALWLGSTVLWFSHLTQTGAGAALAALWLGSTVILFSLLTQTGAGAALAALLNSACLVNLVISF